MDTSKFRDREDAAIRLASALDHYRGQHPLVLGIPRGGVPMARIIADRLEGDLDVVLVRKLGAPGNPELAIGAVDEHGTVMLNRVAGWASADDEYIRHETQRQMELMRERRSMYGAGHASIPVQGRKVIVIDDGLATGATMISALRALRAQHPSRLVCAVPVAASESLAQVRSHADETICLSTPEPFHAVGMYYEQFGAVEDDDVVKALQRQDMDSTVPTGTRSRLLQIPANGAVLDADLVVPDDSLGLVLFAHGSGSSRLSVRNRQVADELQRHGIATLLMDLLTTEEDADRSARFDIRLLTERLAAALRFVSEDPVLGRLPKGLFGASTGAAAALAVAATYTGSIAAMVSRGGRPDLAGAQMLHDVLTPTLLIVGGADPQVMELNRMARELMGNRAELVVIPGATHLFEEPGALESVAEQAAQWFVRWFRDQSPGTGRPTSD
jgi:putative phosphoribosyl transferase